VVFKLFFGQITGVFWVTILLKDEFALLFLEMLDGLPEFIIKNANIELLVHPSINLGGIANSLLAYTAPHYQKPPPNLSVPYTSLSLSVS
jgi:hypothetical protein